MNGILVINKRAGITSFDVVYKVRKLLNTKKVGHTGTLDPLATGVLITCIGKYTKLVSFLTNEYKEYIAEFKIGIKTDTGDITGKIIKEDKYSINENVLRRIINKFPKKYLQEVPKYSAVKIKGKKLYEYARNNEEVKLPKREVEIFELELLEVKNDIVKIRCLVSKGTYIRSLIEDIATRLKTVATMTSLIRTKQGEISIDEAYTLENIKNGKYKFLPLEKIFKNIEIREIDGKQLAEITNGSLIEYDFDKYVVFKHQKDYIAIYQKYEKNPKLAKPYVMF